jgi:hypothetical protein
MEVDRRAGSVPRRESDARPTVTGGHDERDDAQAGRRPGSLTDADDD